MNAATAQSPERYLSRVVDEQLARLVASLPAVAVEGPKAVGKTEAVVHSGPHAYRRRDGVAVIPLELLGP